MTLTLNPSVLFEMQTHRFVADASELGLAPGVFPDCIECSKPLGNGQPFVLIAVVGLDTRRYRQSNGCVSIDILND